MSDRRSHEERRAAVNAAATALTSYESESHGHDLDFNWQHVLDVHGFGEAWAKSVISMPVGEGLVLLRVENTETPEFILMRRREGNPHGPEFGWTAFMWAEQT